MEAYAVIRKWVKVEMDGDEPVNIPALCDAGADYFIEKPDIVRAVYRPAMRELIARFARDEAHASRNGSKPKVVVGDDVVTRGELRGRGEKLACRWERWLEHAGMQHLRLRKMCREEVLIALSERRKRVNTELVTIGFLGDVVEALKPGEVVGERFSDEELERLYQSAEERMKEGPYGHL